MGTARLDIAYDGTRFAGWAAQPGRRTIQSEVEAALERILGQPVALTVAGRTDAGVHATAQVASFEHSGELPDRLAVRLNAVLPRDVSVQRAAAASAGFDARRDARSRAYRYRVLASTIRDPFEESTALWWRYPVDRERLDQCAAAVVGTHDFTAFTPTQSAHTLFERTVLGCEWTEEIRRSAGPDIPGGEAEEMVGTLFNLRIEAPSFMRSQVRVLVGTMLEVASGRRSVDDLGSLLEGAPRHRAGETAPAHGLCLVGVAY